MNQPEFNTARWRRNLEVLAMAAPEVACWLEVASRQEPPQEVESPPPGRLPEGYLPMTGGITVLVGAGCLGSLRQLLDEMPPGHQVFLLEPRAGLLNMGLGCLELEEFLREGDLVILGPHEHALEEALSRHPQLALAEQVEFVHLTPPAQEGAAVWARLYRVLGHALKARDLALRWEEPRGANLVGNLTQTVFMGRAAELVGWAAGRPVVILENGPSLVQGLEELEGHLGGAVVLCSEEALPQALDAGVRPSAVVITRPVLGRLSCYSHPDLERVPLIAEEVAHAPTIRAHPGPRLLCLGARGTALGPFKALANRLTPQHHTLGRQIELAVLMGAGEMVLVGADLVAPSARLMMPAMDGGQVPAGLEEAAAACSVSQALARAGRTALNTSPQGLGLPGCRVADWDQARAVLSPGQPVELEPVSRSRWLSAEEMTSLSRDLTAAAGAATRLWQRAAAPLADFPLPDGEVAGPWLHAADQLFVALAEQAAADPLQAAFLEGCLVRAFLRRHRLVCRTRRHGLTAKEAGRELGLCLADLETRARELARGLKDAAARVEELAQASRDGDQRTLLAFARRQGLPEGP